MCLQTAKKCRDGLNKIPRGDDAIAVGRLLDETGKSFNHQLDFLILLTAKLAPPESALSVVSPEQQVTEAPQWAAVETDQWVAGIPPRGSFGG